MFRPDTLAAAAVFRAGQRDVIAVPAAYGIVRGSGGLAATCDSIVDLASTTGCRFHFTFTIGPLADPVDLAKLAVDLRAIPESRRAHAAAGLPPGLDPRQSSRLDGFPSGEAVFAVGVARTRSRSASTSSTINPRVHHHRQHVPPAARRKGPAPLFGNMFVRVDDVLTHPIGTRRC